MAGRVLVNERKVDKPGTAINSDATLRLLGEDIPFVSRGGLKLQAALEHFKVDVRGRIALDVGASTGGFTDCLLQRGASRVYAVDVGYGQLAEKLRQDSRVVNMERTNIRHLDALPEAPSVIVVDASFISLELVLPPALRLGAKQVDVLALIKPQFEVGRGQVGKGGVVREQHQHLAVLAKVQNWCGEWGLSHQEPIPSPITGAKKGNVEFLIHAWR